MRKGVGVSGRCAEAKKLGLARDGESGKPDSSLIDHEAVSDAREGERGGLGAPASSGSRRTGDTDTR